MGKSVFYIAQIDEILGEIKKAFGAFSVQARATGLGGLSIRIATNDLKNELERRYDGK